MCQCRLINCKKCTTMVQDIDSRGDVCSGEEGIYGNSLLSCQFCYESKTTLQNKINVNIYKLIYYKIYINEYHIYLKTIYIYICIIYIYINILLNSHHFEYNHFCICNILYKTWYTVDT